MLSIRRTYRCSRVRPKVNLDFARESSGEDAGSFEEGRPELGELMTVADLYNVELLDDTSVQGELFSLELRKNGAAEVDSHDIEELHLGLEIALISLNVASHRAHIVRVLEHRGHRLFALVHILNVSLCALNLLFDILDALLAIKILFVCGGKGVQVVNLSLVPVIKISEGIAQVLGRVSHLSSQVIVVGVLHDKV